MCKIIGVFIVQGVFFRCLSTEHLAFAVSKFCWSVSIGSLSGRWVRKINTYPQCPTSNEVEMHGWPRRPRTFLWWCGQECDAMLGLVNIPTLA